MIKGSAGKIGVVGAGSWGTTLANVLANKGFDVHLWAREPEVVAQIRSEKENSVFLPGVKLDPRLEAGGDLEETVVDKDVILMVVPSHVFRSVTERIAGYVKGGVPVAAATKGIENDTLMMMSEIVREVLGRDFEEMFACIAGPSFAKEVSQKHPTAVTVACKDLGHSERMQKLLNTEFLRVYTSDDVVGAQLGGALKNVIAIAAGAADGLNFGHNARAALITRGLAEITRLGVAMGARPLTFAGLAGLGDLVLTCTGDLSRNRSVGLKIGQGHDIEEINKEMTMVAEGVKNAESAYQLGKRMGVELPIINEVYYILYEGKAPLDAVKDLMSRELKVELEH